jgi:hypothetical protein
VYLILFSRHKSVASLHAEQPSIEYIVNEPITFGLEEEEKLYFTDCFIRGDDLRFRDFLRGDDLRFRDFLRGDDLRFRDFLRGDDFLYFILGDRLFLDFFRDFLRGDRLFLDFFIGDFLRFLDFLLDFFIGDFLRFLDFLLDFLLGDRLFLDFLIGDGRFLYFLLLRDCGILSYTIYFKDLNLLVKNVRM